MKVDVDMDTKDRFHVSSWWATSPDFVVDALRKQLEAAAAVWPELIAFRIAGSFSGDGKAAGGAAGGRARAAALTPERRSEIASDAAKARWGDVTKEQVAKIDALVKPEFETGDWKTVEKE